MLSTAHSPVLISMTAMCAKPGSPQRPSNDRSPECRRSAACCQASRFTMERAQFMSAQQRRDMPEPRDDRRRKPDAGREDKRKMGEYRQERGLRTLIAAVRIAEDETVQ